MGAHTDDLGALRPQVEAVIRDCHELAQAIRQSRRTRRLLLLALILFLVLVGVMFYQMVAPWIGEQNQTQIRQMFEKKFSGNSDQYMREVQKLVDKTSPVLTEAFYSQAKKDLPGFLDAMEKEKGALTENLEKQLSDKLSTHYAQLLAHHQHLLEEEFPPLKNKEMQDKMVGNLTIVMDNLVKKHYSDELQGEMLTFFDYWEKFPVAAPPGKGDPSLQDQFVADMFDILKYKLASSERLAQR